MLSWKPQVLQLVFLMDIQPMNINRLNQFKNIDCILYKLIELKK